MMSSLLRRPFGSHGKVHEITPASAGWRYVGFSLYRLRPGETAAEATSATLPAATNSPATSYRAAATSAAWLDPVRRARAWRPATCSTLPGTYLAIWLRAYKLWLVRAATPR